MASGMVLDHGIHTRSIAIGSGSVVSLDDGRDDASLCGRSVCRGRVLWRHEAAMAWLHLSVSSARRVFNEMEAEDNGIVGASLTVDRRLLPHSSTIHVAPVKRCYGGPLVKGCPGYDHGKQQAGWLCMAAHGSTSLLSSADVSNKGTSTSLGTLSFSMCTPMRLCTWTLGQASVVFSAAHGQSEMSVASSQKKMTDPLQQSRFVCAEAGCTAAHWRQDRSWKPSRERERWRMATGRRSHWVRIWTGALRAAQCGRRLSSRGCRAPAVNAECATQRCQVRRQMAEARRSPQSIAADRASRSALCALGAAQQASPSGLPLNFPALLGGAPRLRKQLAGLHGATRQHRRGWPDAGQAVAREGQRCAHDAARRHDVERGPPGPASPLAIGPMDQEDANYPVATQA
ncbi:hypothetical protein PSPO01_14965 [Paraphaeosphaeria sporulosa]